MGNNIVTPIGASDETMVQHETSSGDSSRTGDRDSLFSSHETVEVSPPSEVIDLTIDTHDNEDNKVTISDEEDPFASSETVQSRPVPASLKPPVPSRIVDRVHPRPGIMDKRYLLAFTVGIETATDLYLRYGVSYGEETAHYNEMIRRRDRDLFKRKTRSNLAGKASSSAAKSREGAEPKTSCSASSFVPNSKKRKEPEAGCIASSFVAANNDEDALPVASPAAKRQKRNRPMIVDSEDEEDGQETVGGRRPASQCLKGPMKLDDTEHREEAAADDAFDSLDAEHEAAEDGTAKQKLSRNKRKTIGSDVVNDPSTLDAEPTPEEPLKKRRRMGSNYIPELERLSAPTMSSVRPSRATRRNYRE